MSDFIFSVLSYILLYKYVALFLIAYSAALLIPLPSNTTLLAASAFASQGYLNIYVVILVALIANVLGDMTGFMISRLYGKQFLMHIGLRRMLESKRYTQVESFFVTRQRASIFTTRFFGGVGPLVNILAGISSKVSFSKFCVYGISGEIVYVLSLSLPGYFFGTTWQDSLGSFEYISVGVVFVVLIVIIRKVYMYKVK